MDIKIPEVGESVFEALVAKWHRQDGEQVSRDEPVCEIETDKITLEVNAEADGTLRIKVPEGTRVKIGSVIGVIEEGGTGGATGVTGREGAKKEAPAGEQEKEETPATPAPAATRHVSPSERKSAREKEGGGTAEEKGKEKVVEAVFTTESKPGPVEAVKSEEPAPYATQPVSEERVTRKPMSPIRRRIAERMLAARQQTAMLTTFNEADMGRVMELRRKYGGEFLKKHGVKLGFMSFFVKACCEALREFPAVNGRIEGDDIVLHNFYDIGIAVSGEKGLVVPVMRDVDRLHFAEIERAIDDYTDKIRTNRLAIADLEGGTFTITNGGIFGSLMSTPILNPPQSGVLGMHAIQDRPVARDGKIVIRPMMYLALSYDHRIIDGREAVLFLKKVKEYLEEPEEMLLEG
ncbi:MAG TPA: 2-oxoglutarate dehydrogenase complex dihydrolipoyllysine-residue succinyltransferase [Geobacteraceae bacterium]|nr:2-oxoglutarate dehydrogenase complex dihydrolipoyllysine-residue succinyltransferase [Geobacteraceae bacterium]